MRGKGKKLKKGGGRERKPGKAPTFQKQFKDLGRTPPKGKKCPEKKKNGRHSGGGGALEHPDETAY